MKMNNLTCQQKFVPIKLLDFSDKEKILWAFMQNYQLIYKGNKFQTSFRLLHSNIQQ